MRTEVTISRDLLTLDAVVAREFAAAQDGVAEEIAIAWRDAVEAVGAVDSRRYLDSIDVRARAERTGDVRTLLIEAPAAEGYSDVVERGWINRGRGQESYPGRHPAQKGIEEADAHVGTQLDGAGRRIEG
jgi:hypothetical protein